MFTEIFGSNKPRCQHFSDDGKRCAADPQTNNKFCFMHDPEQKEKQAEVRKKGGQARSQPYEVKIPAGLQFPSLDSVPQVRQFLTQVFYYTHIGEMDQRSARSYYYMGNSIIAALKEEARQQYRAHIVADKESRRLRRESDPWSPHFGASKKAAKAKEEAEKAEGKLSAENQANDNDNKEEVQQSLVADAAARSMRELNKLKKEEEKKQKERERTQARQQSAEQENAKKETVEKDSAKTELQECDSDRESQPGPISHHEAERSEAVPGLALETSQLPKPVRDYIVYGNSTFPPFETIDANRHAALTQYMRAVHEYADLGPKRSIRPVSFAFKGRRSRS